jgi:transcriptional regulator with XRE-family HTH domain
LARYRKTNGLTQEELAGRAGLDRSFISLLEQGKRVPTIKTLGMLAEIFQIKPEELLAK